jgi:hypothetical protein
MRGADDRGPDGRDRMDSKMAEETQHDAGRNGSGPRPALLLGSVAVRAVSTCRKGRPTTRPGIQEFAKASAATFTCRPPQRTATKEPT